jgi:hypothetical protein
LVSLGWQAQHKQAAPCYTKKTSTLSEVQQSANLRSHLLQQLPPLLNHLRPHIQQRRKGHHHNNCSLPAQAWQCLQCSNALLQQAAALVQDGRLLQKETASS